MDPRTRRYGIALTCALAVVVLLTGCDVDNDGKITLHDILVVFLGELAEANCEWGGPDDNEEGNITNRTLVSSTRAVLLFVKHHIFVGGKLDASGAWNPDAVVDTSYGDWTRNKTLIKKANARQLSEMLNTNRIFEVNGTNIRIYSVGGPSIVYEPDALPTTCGVWGPTVNTQKITTSIANSDPGFIHVFWGWGNDQAVVATGLNFKVVVCSYDLPSDTLAHEFVHALGVEWHSDISGNLMNGELTERGENLTQAQIQQMWDYINERGQKLLSLTCDAVAQP